MLCIYVSVSVYVYICICLFMFTPVMFAVYLHVYFTFSQCVFILAQKFKYVLVEITVNSIQKEMKKDSSVSTNAAKHRNCRHSQAF